MRKKDYLKYLRDLFNGNKQHMLEMMEVLLEDLPAKLNGLEKQINQRNWVETEKSAHCIKTSYVYMGQHDMALTAERIERIAKERGSWTEALMLLDVLRTNSREPLDFYRLESSALKKKLGMRNE